MLPDPLEERKERHAYFSCIARMPDHPHAAQAAERAGLLGFSIIQIVAMRCARAPQTLTRKQQLASLLSHQALTSASPAPAKFPRVH